MVPSLLPVNTEVNISGRLHSMHQIQLHIRDDNVGLEAVENRTIVLSAISQSCHNLQFGNTQILIKDDDSKKLRFTLLPISVMIYSRHLPQLSVCKTEVTETE